VWVREVRREEGTAPMIGKLYATVIDSPDPARAAAFYGAILGMPVEYEDDVWVRLGDPGPGSITFQLAPDHVAPQWPNPGHPQQFHLDIEVTDLQAADRQVLELGAVFLEERSETDWVWRVYNDLDGHPFCFVCRR